MDCRVCCGIGVHGQQQKVKRCLVVLLLPAAAEITNSSFNSEGFYQIMVRAGICSARACSCKLVFAWQALVTGGLPTAAARILQERAVSWC